eukprot:TRINITY_DN6294_c0_g1_i1.p1 TRINITY_DN6294_c0_g1~~TRINITY_DN6294_c0_g1_i1.p1  ORF type:complete len:292 (+),score=19.82 TRINITY_DN6294_c0_g1_i1:372-1247(+)
MTPFSVASTAFVAVLCISLPWSPARILFAEAKNLVIKSSSSSEEVLRMSSDGILAVKDVFLKDNQTTIVALVSNLTSIIDSLQRDLQQLRQLFAVQNETIQRLQDAIIVPHAEFFRWGNGTCPPGSQTLVGNGTTFIGQHSYGETGALCAPWNTSLRIQPAAQEFSDYVVAEIDNQSPGYIDKIEDRSYVKCAQCVYPQKSSCAVVLQSTSTSPCPLAATKVYSGVMMASELASSGPLCVDANDFDSTSKNPDPKSLAQSSPLISFISAPQPRPVTVQDRNPNYYCSICCL